MKTVDRQPLPIERCPYLGLHDDARTSLMYPSHWNYCYHAEPPESILIAHQVHACLGMSYVQCPLIVSNQWERLPRSLRGKGNRYPQKRGLPSGLLWLVLVFLLILILGLIFIPDRNLPLQVISKIL